MITIKDRQRLLNLNYMAIYLMLTSDEIAQYGDKLKNLNRHTTLTRGLFHFDVVERRDNPSLQFRKNLRISHCRTTPRNPNDRLGF